MAAYLISFDINGGESSDYEEIHSIIQKTFSINCKILTTTYLVKTSTDIDLNKERVKIEKSNKKFTSVIIAKIDNWSGNYPNNIVDCVKKNIRN